MELIKRVRGQADLMEDQPENQKSIALREHIMLPLVLIQQYALAELRKNDVKHPDLFEQMVVRSMYGIVNASRNSA